MNKTNWILAGGFALMLSLIGCGGASTRPAPESLPQGLSVFEVAEDFGVSGAFKAGEHVVFFETRRGAARPDFHKATSPELGDFEIDARFLDEKGNTIAIQRGGDSLVDKTWEDDLQKQEDAHKVVVTAEHLDLAGQAAKAIAAYKFPSQVSFQTNQLAQLGEGAKVPVVDNTKVTEVAKDVAGYENISLGMNATYEIHYKYIGCVAWICAGQHSAVRARTATGTIYDSCQHGTCAGGMSAIACTGSGSGSGTGATFQRETSTSISSVTGSCSTPYNWNSGGGTHNCHDDSTMIGKSIKYGLQSTTAGACQGQNWWYGPGQSGHPCP